MMVGSNDNPKTPREASSRKGRIEAVKESPGKQGDKSHHQLKRWRAELGTCRQGGSTDDRLPVLQSGWEAVGTREE